MAVIPLTLTISLCLVFTFLVFFLRENSRRRFSSAEREALLPLADEVPHIVRSAAQLDSTPAALAHGRYGRRKDRDRSSA